MFSDTLSLFLLLKKLKGKRKATSEEVFGISGGEEEETLINTHLILFRLSYLSLSLSLPRYKLLKYPTLSYYKNMAADNPRTSIPFTHLSHLHTNKRCV